MDIIITNIFKIILFLMVLFFVIGCKKTEYNVKLNGIQFIKLHTSSTGSQTGYMTNDNTINTLPCGEGWVHFKNNELISCRLSKDLTFNNVFSPSNSWIHLPYHINQKGFAISFSKDVEIQGYICEGTGGYKGTRTSFYDSGKLKSFYPVGDLIVSGVPCKATPFVNIQLHENGYLKSCKLSDEFVTNGISIKKGVIIEFTKDGKFK